MSTITKTLCDNCGAELSKIMMVGGEPVGPSLRVQLPSDAGPMFAPDVYDVCNIKCMKKLITKHEKGQLK